MINRLCIFMQICIFMNTIKNMEASKKFVSPTICYNWYCILDILYTFAQYAYSVQSQFCSQSNVESL